MMRFCPKCGTERPASEFFCQGQIDGEECGWDLSAEPIRQEGWRPARVGPPKAPAETRSPAETGAPAEPRSPAETSAATGASALAKTGAWPDRPVRACQNGHPMEEGDLICPVCGADPAAPEPEEGSLEILSIGEWEIIGEPERIYESNMLYPVRHAQSGQNATLRLFGAGYEPDPRVYEAIRRLPRDAAPQIYDWGRWEGRFYSVSETFPGKFLSDLALERAGPEKIRRVVSELGRALRDLAEEGVRYRDLKPSVLAVRTEEPLDLVITGYGSALISESDLDDAAPLETSLYTAPEAIVGTVSPASDWWSLGMILLEMLTGEALAKGVHQKAFAIQIIARGVDIPKDLAPDLRLLLMGLLTRDHAERWRWPQVEAWLEGSPQEPPPEWQEPPIAEEKTTILLGEKRFSSPELFALQAAEAENWDKASALLRRGGLATWLDSLAGRFPDNPRRQRAADAIFSPGPPEGPPASATREVTDSASVGPSEARRWAEDHRLMVALRLMNNSMPLVIRGELLSPGWLLANPKEAYELVSGEIPLLLQGCLPDDANWLLRLKIRLEKTRARASNLDIALNEEALRIYCLSASQARLAAIWADRLKSFPESEHPGVSRLLTLPNLADIDLVILLSADLGLFTPAKEVLDQAKRLAGENNVQQFSLASASRLIELPKPELRRALDKRLEDFAFSGNAFLDRSAQEFRLDRRLDLAKILIILGTPESAWAKPKKTAFLHQLLGHFEKRIASSGSRGPLVRTLISERSSNVDLMELASESRSAESLTNHVLERGQAEMALDPVIFREAAGERLFARLERLLGTNRAYLRDTGLNGLHMGFPYLVFNVGQPGRVPRVMPLLLWPAAIKGDPRSKSLKLSFDRARDEIRLNPVLEATVGRQAQARWKEAADKLLSVSFADARGAMEILGDAADIVEKDLQSLSPLTRQTPPSTQTLVCSAALIHVTFAGQAVSEELRALSQEASGPGALGTLLEMYDPPEGQGTSSDWPSHFVTHRDPTQESAVQLSRLPRGLLVEGPPGTGKSQTIVNMISQALGDKRSVLVICQKRAALDVVFKRLEAAGLADRTMLLTDASNERTSVIKRVRAQEERFRQEERPNVQALARERDALISLVEKLEDEIDASHEALHAVDPRSGLSYREIADRLVELDGEAMGLENPPLATLLSPLPADKLWDLAEKCAPYANLWLESRFEGSPLHCLNSAAPDDRWADSLGEDVSRLLAAEEARSSRLGAETGPDAAARDRALQGFHALSGAFFEGFRGNIPAEIPRFVILMREPGAPGGQSKWEAASSAAESVCRELGACPMADLSPILSPSLARAPNRQLKSLVRASDPEELGFWRKIAPWRIFGRIRMNSLLRKAGLDLSSEEARVEAEAELYRAAKLELSVKPLRARLRTMMARIGLKSLSGDETANLPAMAGKLRESLRTLGPPLWSLRSLPPDFPLEAALLRGDAAALGEALAKLKAASERQALALGSLEAIEAAKERFSPEFRDRLLEAINNAQIAPPILKPVADELPRAKPFMAFARRLESLPEGARDLFALMRPLESPLASIAPEKRGRVFRALALTEALSAWKRTLEEENGSLDATTKEIGEKIKRLKELDDKLRDMNVKILTADINPAKIAKRGDWEKVTRLTNKRALRLREFIKQAAPLGLFEFRPVWLLNPDTASRILPRVQNLFDLAIYDEASQMPVEYSVPTLYRARAAIVSGDDKQMPPSSFFRTSAGEDDSFADPLTDSDSEEDPVESDEAKPQIMDCADMLELARRTLPQSTLQVHYRSAYRQLIDFSNAAFYDGQLQVPANRPLERVLKDQPLKYVNARGLYSDQMNEAEAAEVVSILSGIWAAPGKPSAGVVTFNQKQASLISDLIGERALQDDAFGEAYRRESNRQDDGEDMSFFVKNVENVQGDERDVIIFSSTFGKNSDGRFIRNFGALGHSGGERRLNVAITRARRQVVLVTSMPLGDISDMLATKRLPAAPRDYLQLYWAYAQAISLGDFAGAEKLLRRTAGSGAEPSSHDAGQSGVLAAAKAALESAGWLTAPGEAGSVFGLDLLLEDKEAGTFFMGIEIDSPRHPLLAKARAREIWRRGVLERGIPAIYRVSSKGWLENPAKEKADLLAAAKLAGRGKEGQS